MQVVFSGSDACVAPVLSPEEAVGVITDQRSVIPAPHPRLSRTSPHPFAGETNTESNLEPGEHTDILLKEFGISTEARKKLAAEGAFGRNARELSKL